MRFFMKEYYELFRTYKKFIKNNLFIALLFFVAFMIIIYLLFSSNTFTSKLVQNFGFVGIFIGSLFTNSTVFIPIPFDVILIPILINPMLIGLDKSLFNILLMCFAAGFGAALGECSSYFFGSLGSESIKKLSKKDVQKLEEFKESIHSSGPIVLFLASLIPFPFDIVGVAAGVIKYNFYIFFISVLVGKLTRYFILGLSIFYSVEIIVSFLV
ncbi:MAG: VTT domain-containing protein [Candidatus Diapherotrites archaeon]|nr:VTT domain-containing protein [Candidatus Diapherotrites archaeon]